MVNNPPAVQEMQETGLIGEDPLEERRATHSSILAWRIPWTEELGGPQSTGSQRAGHDWSDVARRQMPLIPLRNRVYGLSALAAQPNSLGSNSTSTTLLRPGSSSEKWDPRNGVYLPGLRWVSVYERTCIITCVWSDLLSISHVGLLWPHGW